jgi:hypothetical protein
MPEELLGRSAQSDSGPYSVLLAMEDEVRHYQQALETIRLKVKTAGWE